MTRPTGLVILALALGCSRPETPPVEPAEGSVAYETPGNLTSEKPLGCAPLADVTSEHTPADLYPAMVKCMAEDRVPEAIDLYAIAYTYVMFDIERVTDVSAHQAKPALEAETLRALPPEQNERF